MGMNGHIGDGSEIDNVNGTESSKIFNNCRVYNTDLSNGASIGDFSTVRDSSLGEHTSIQRYGDIWGGEFGRYTCVGRVSTVQYTTVGSFCALADYLTIGCDDHDYEMITTHPFWHDCSWGISDDKQYSDYYRNYEYTPPCSIGNDVWIGAGVIVCRNVRIGDGCVIGAGAVITKDIPPYSVVVGVPGRVIKKRFDDDTIQRLLICKWWDLPIDIIRSNIHIFRNGHINNRKLSELEELCFKYNIGKKDQ